MSRILARRVAQYSRTFITSSFRPAFATGPSPPRLPTKEQEEFERLQKTSTGAFSTPKTPSNTRPQINQSPASQAQGTTTDASAVQTEDQGADAILEAKIEAQGKGTELHPDVRRGAKAEFEGDRNPKTGEVGGPKNEPLRWGEKSDWSYNGRVTDF